jgi:hypothetical protein
VQPASIPTSAHLRWYANMFRVDGVQYILTTNAASLYSVVIYGRGVTSPDTYLKLFLPALSEQLQSDTMQIIHKRCIEPYTSKIVLAKTEDRSVLGSMNDMVNVSKLKLGYDPISLSDLSHAINRIPFSALGYGFPWEAFAQLPPET